MGYEKIMGRPHPAVRKKKLKQLAADQAAAAKRSQHGDHHRPHGEAQSLGGGKQGKFHFELRSALKGFFSTSVATTTLSNKQHSTVQYFHDSIWRLFANN